MSESRTAFVASPQESSPLPRPRISEEGQRFELVAAAVRRCYLILRRLQTGVSGPDARYGDALLTYLVAREPALADYLEAAKSDARLALACAEGDVAWLRCVRGDTLREAAEPQEPPSIWKRMKEFLGSVLKTPAFVSVLAAVVGVVLGASHLQHMSFRRQKQFESQFERLKEGQKLAADLRTGVDQLLWQVVANERLTSVGGVPILGGRELFARFRKMLIEIDTLTIIFTPDKDVSAAVARGIKALSDLQECMTAKQAAVEHRRCSDAFDMDSFDIVIDKLGALRLRLLEQD